jgi:plasmid replication initiation protein
LIQAHFTQKYSNLLYEILASAHYAGGQYIAIDIADLRSRLQLPENKLVNYSDFDRFVLTPASREINSHASFATKYHTERKGMKVTRVVFEMTNKRNISQLESAIHVIPPKRPRLFIDDPEIEAAYAYLLNAETNERRKYFDMACRRAMKNKQAIDEGVFDRPDLWFKWIEKELLKVVS